MDKNDINTLNQLNDEEKITYLKAAYKKSQKTADITKWVFVGTLVFAIILLIFYIATFKNFKDSLALFIFTLICNLLQVDFIFFDVPPAIAPANPKNAPPIKALPRPPVAKVWPSSIIS